jgi:heme a synthase
VDSGAAALDLNDLPAPAPWQRRFARFATFLLAYLLFVIVFGAWVRITGSGAGCGDHWPSCHGELVPRTPTAQTIIEYTHRLTSGLLGLMALALPIWAWRSFPPGHPVRRSSVLTLVLVVVEAAIGAGLVLNQLVASNASQARAVAVALHLGNTLLLTACAALSVAFASETASQMLPGRLSASTVPDGGWLLGLLLAGLLLVSSSGAVTALGDTLFPVQARAGSLAPAASAHFLVQLRVVHPLLAAGVVCLAFGVARRFMDAPATRFWAWAVGCLAAVQLGLGGLNIALNAPGWLQLAHLLTAQLLWISAVLLSLRWRRARALS